MISVRSLRLSQAGRYLLAGVAALLLPPGCGQGFVPPPAPVGGHPPEDASRLALGHDLHQAKCATCHPFVDPAGFSPGQLRQEVMPLMGRKAGLAAAEAQAVLDYLLAVRKSAASGR